MNNFENQFDIIVKKHQNIEKSLSNQDNLDRNNLIKLNKEYSELTPVVKSINQYNSVKKDIENLNSLLNDKDISIRKMAEDELIEKNKKIKSLEQDLLNFLFQKILMMKKILF